MLNCVKTTGLSGAKQGQTGPNKALWSKIRPIGAKQGQTWPIWGKRDQSGTKGANLVQIELNGEKQKQNLNALSIIDLFLMPYAQSHIPYFLFFSPFIRKPHAISLIPIQLSIIPYPLLLINNPLSLIHYQLSLILYPLTLIPCPLSLIPYPISLTPYTLLHIPYP